MLAQLSEAHQAVLQCIAAMADATDHRAEKLEYSKARYAVSRTSLARRQLFQSICRELSGRLVGSDADDLAEIQQIDGKLLSQSAAHISRWTAPAVEQDWAGYCQASHAIREQMKRELAAERRLLFPILERLATASS
jgi:hypothetical protein